MDSNSVIRLYNRENVHCLSILPCADNNYDLCYPSGGVLYCGISQELVDAFIEGIGLESFDNIHNKRKDSHSPKCSGCGQESSCLKRELCPQCRGD